MSTLENFQQEWEQIQCDTNLPRRIERHHQFGERFRMEHEAQKKLCSTLEGKLALLMQHNDNPAPTSHTQNTSTGGETVAELWTLLQELQKSITELTQRSVQVCAASKGRGGAGGGSRSASRAREPDPLKSAFDKLERFSRVRDTLHALLDTPLDAQIVHSPKQGGAPPQASPGGAGISAEDVDEGEDEGEGECEGNGGSDSDSVSDVAPRRSQRRRKKT